MIKLDNISVMFGKRKILKQVSLQLEKGQSLAIIGPNGAGKSTLLRVMGGHVIPNQGHIFLDGRELHLIHRKNRAQRLAFMPQIPQIETQFTAFETVMLARYPYLGRFQSETEHDRDICKQSMERTGCWALREQKLDEISGGERQRVLLAQVYAQEPELLLLDEPITYLDLFHQLELLSMLKKEQQRGLTWVAVLHDINLAAQYCDYLLLMDKGELILQDTPERVLRSGMIDEVFGVRTSIVENENLHVPQLVITPR